MYLNMYKVVKDVKLPYLFKNAIKLEYLEMLKIFKNVSLLNFFGNDVKFKHLTI